jgi:hypothetical protein
MTPRQALAFVEKRGIVLESARGPVPSLAETIAGEPLRASWWGHPKGDSIFACSRAIRNSKDVLTCRLIDGKVTYVHRRLWPALVRLSDNFRAHRLASIKEIHTAAGKHRIDTVPFSRWVLPEERRKGAKLSIGQASALLEGAGMTKFGSGK